MRQDRSKQEVVIDHLVVEKGGGARPATASCGDMLGDRRPGLAGMFAGAVAFHEGVFAEGFLVGDIASRCHPVDNGTEAGLEEIGTDGRCEESQGEEGVSPEVGEVLPGSGEEFLAVGKEGECIQVAMGIGAGQAGPRAGSQEAVDGNGRQVRIITGCDDIGTDLPNGRRVQCKATIGIDRHGGAVARFDLDGVGMATIQAGSFDGEGTVGGSAGDGDGVATQARDQAGTVADIADGADIAEDGWCEPEFGRVGDDRDGDALDAVGLLIEGGEGTVEVQGDIGVVDTALQENPAVAGGEGNDDPWCDA